MPGTDENQARGSIGERSGSRQLHQDVNRDARMQAWDGRERYLGCEQQAR